MIQTLFGPPPDPGLLDRFKTAVAKTRDNLVDQIDELVQGKKEIDAELLDNLEMALISSDVGVRTASETLDAVRQKLSRRQLTDANELKTTIAEHLMGILAGVAGKERPSPVPPRVILIVGAFALCARGAGAGSCGAGIPACRVGIRADIHRSPGSGRSQRPPYARRNAGAAA
jgi:hypothetical protein